VQTNLYFKSGSAINDPLQGLESKVGARDFETDLQLILSTGHANTGEDLHRKQGDEPDQLSNKHGNLGKLGIIFLMLDLVSLLTYSISKQLLEYYSQHGGKIIEKANARSNALDT